MLLYNQIKNFGSLIKFSHTIFALPFALSMYVVLVSENGFNFRQLFWIILALIFARTSAMSFNRYLDRDIDARNLRTKNREIPSGKVSIAQTVILFTLSSLFFLYSSYKLGLNCFYLAPLVLFFLCFYSYTKRFTKYAHIFLGFALALAPGGVWFAVTDAWSLKPLSLMLGVLFWVAGFDILYSCQDYEFDKKENLYSIPAKFGINKAFLIAKFFHVLSIFFLITFGIIFSLNFIFYLGLSFFSFFLISQYFIVSPSNLEKIDAAFFNKNAYASMVFFISVLLDTIY